MANSRGARQAASQRLNTSRLMPTNAQSQRTNGRQSGDYPETGFEEIGARATLRNTSLPPSGLLGHLVGDLGT